MNQHDDTEPVGGLEPIAIIGMACRVPGAATLKEFWHNLEHGVESIRSFTPEEVLAAGASPHSVRDPNYVRAAPVLDNIEDFDAARFGFTRREAEILDPQHRVFLECAAAALEHAGYDPARYPGEIGVYGGVGASEYQWYHIQPNSALVSAVGGMAVALANNSDYVSTLVSYKLNLRGPSLSVATACSTGLVATHLACEAVRNGECDMALAGAASVELTQLRGYLYQEGGILSPDGHCRSFDADAKGTLWGSGGGVVVLKRLSDALADGDTIHAVILGSSVNNDGSDKVGFSAPSISGQSEVISQALGVAGVAARSISYVEAHGTATTVGDPIEARALTEVFQRSTDERGFCRLGTVKPNIGHLAAAAGVVGLIKTVLALEHQALPPTLHYHQPNPAIDFDSSPFRVVSELERWPRSQTPRRAGVSSFGMGGTNAHAIVEEGPYLPVSTPSSTPQVVVLSAHTQSALDTMSAEIVAHLRAHDDLVLDDAAYTLQLGRQPLPYRRAVVCHDLDDAADVLAGSAPRRLVTGKASSPRRQVFLFPGQGTQHVGMARELYERYDVLRQHIDRGAELLRPQLGYDLREVLFASGDKTAAAAERIDRTSTTQPALFVVEYAMAKLWMSWGVTPEAMIGHSLGEYVAACLAGVFSFEDALTLVAARAQLMQEQPAGAMLAVALDEESLELEGTGLALAAVNSPHSCVVSGPSAAIEAYEEELSEIGIPKNRLRTSHAFHSPMMEPVREAFAALIGQVERNAPHIPVMSNVTGSWLTADQATSADYWTAHMCGTVRFGPGLENLLQDAPSVLLEVGPGGILSGLARMQLPVDTPDPVTTLPPGITSEVEAMLAAAGRLWSLGVDIDWSAMHTAPRRRVPLPGRPFERQRHWIEDAKQAGAPAAPAVHEDKLPMEQWFWVPCWREVPRRSPVAADALPQHGPWLVLCDPDGHLDGFIELLRARGDRVVTVTPGDEFVSLSDSAFVIHPERSADYERLLDLLVEQGAVPTALVHAWTLGNAAADPLDAPTAQRTLALAFWSLLLLTQALAGRGHTEDLQVTVFSSNAHHVTGDDVDNPAKALVTGPLRVLPLEFPGLVCRHVDMDLPVHPGATDFSALLVDELAGVGTEPVVAYRRAKRWVPTLEQARLEPPVADRASLRRHGVYLITGGLGGVGLSLAEDLVRRVQARLVLVGRSTAPPREDWQRLAGSAGRLGRQARQLLQLEELGGELLVLSADVSDPAEVERVRAAALARFGEVNGVIHAAGVAGGTMVEAQSAETAGRVLVPKVFGTLALARAFRDDPIDFLALCSSVTAIAGGIGQVDYCAANAFLDAFAHARSDAGQPVVSVNWGAWLEVGMAAETQGPGAFRELERGVRQDHVDHPLLDVAETAEGNSRVVCSVTLDPTTHWVVDEHRIHGTPVLPGTGYLEMVRAAFARGQARPVELRDVVFLAPLTVQQGGTRDVRVLLDNAADGGDFQVESWTGAQWQKHAHGSVYWAAPAPTPVTDLDRVLHRCPRLEPGLSLPDSASGMLTFGPRWSSLRQVNIGTGEELALLEAPDLVRAELPQYWIHPAVLDEATAFGEFGSAAQGQYLPLGYGRLTIRAPMPARLYSHLRHRDSGSAELIVCDITLLDENGSVVADISDFMLRRIDEAEVSGMVAQERSDGAQAAAFVEPTPSAVDGDVGIRPTEGGEAFARVLGARLGAQVVVSALHMVTLTEKVSRIDRNRLAEGLDGRILTEGMSPQVLEGDYVAPTTDLERALVQMWEEATGSTGIGIEHDFFELGGNSLVAAQLIARVRATMGAKLPMRMIFESPTIAGMAKVIEASERAAS